MLFIIADIILLLIYLGLRKWLSSGSTESELIDLFLMIMIMEFSNLTLKHHGLDLWIRIILLILVIALLSAYNYYYQKEFSKKKKKVIGVIIVGIMYIAVRSYLV